MVSAKHLLALAALALPALCQPDWAINFWTTDGCGASQPNYSTVYHGGYSGRDSNECVGITADKADCGVTFVGNDINTYPCEGPNGPGLNGAPLKGFGGGGSCDFYTDAACSQGHVHHDLASYKGFSGYPKSVCYSNRNLLNFKYFQSFKCTKA